MPYLGIFGQERFNKLLSHLEAASSNLSSCKILQKTKLPNWVPQISYLGIFGIEI